MKKHYVSVLLVGLFFLSGCADMNMPKPGDIIKNPLGSNAVKIGMTRNEVINIYGDPNSRTTVIASGWGNEREEWFYKARMSTLPLGGGYLMEDLFLYFDGDNLTTISKAALGEPEKPNNIQGNRATN